MKTMKKGIIAVLATLVLAVLAVGAAAPVQAASWKKMSLKKYKQDPYKAYYAGKKASKIKLTFDAEGTTATVTFKKSKIKSDVAKLKKALTKKKTTTFTYKSTNKKAKAILKINKKSGSFTVTNSGKTIISKQFTVKKKSSKQFLLTSKVAGTKLTLLFDNAKKSASFRLLNGDTKNWKKNQVARFGVSEVNKKLVAQSALPFLKITKAQYK